MTKPCGTCRSVLCLQFTLWRGPGDAGCLSAGHRAIPERRASRGMGGTRDALMRLTSRTAGLPARNRRLVPRPAVGASLRQRFSHVRGMAGGDFVPPSEAPLEGWCIRRQRPSVPGRPCPYSFQCKGDGRPSMPRSHPPYGRSFRRRFRGPDGPSFPSAPRSRSAG